MIPHLASTHCHRCRRSNSAVGHLVYIPNIRLLGISHRPMLRREETKMLLPGSPEGGFQFCFGRCRWLTYCFTARLFLPAVSSYVLMNSSCVAAMPRLACLTSLYDCLLPASQRTGLYLHLLRSIKKSRVDEGIVGGKAALGSGQTKRLMPEYRRGTHDWKLGMSFEAMVSEW
ncbi:hypothetical protein F4818DRAFT_405891 [Hypoxylon cercidicola]|nr:hypothetical protein F4818DRAFT_405891 [Hypoxylon cercidicola]